MAKLPHSSGLETVKALSRAGWQIRAQRGSHIVMVREGSIYTIGIPLHDELKPGLLRKIINEAGLTVEEFTGLL
jgi:predicted RNA binding protein YcfA (HicA-like mRNA interferase family)